ncbi:dimethylarginine dimethylaminohydrolase family protein [Sphingobacterium sp. HJSM2_6]|uniref:dimethylarginine dimethylaminohydrolase family protein n=1 Tax=Sphingobacterium sp. HJSM2_6 TaxID=3366264 RepID=UPI003BBE258A
MLRLHIDSETNKLHTVLLGIANSNGPTPKPEEAYDPKSLKHIRAGTYPLEEDMLLELEAFHQVLLKHHINVLRPEIIPNLNQIFTRDIGFVIDDYFIKSNILPDRAQEWEAIQAIISQVQSNQLINPPSHVHIEGGDVLLHHEHLFIGTYTGSDYSLLNTARTNQHAVAFLQELFPHKIIKAFDLIKSMKDPKANALHLDCCFQPVGSHYGIIYKGGFRNEQDYEYLVDLFGKENLFHIDATGMYEMNSNVFSISDTVVVSERRFHALNQWLRNRGILVEEIPYYEIGKQEGLLRCSTLPLLRD